MELIPYCGALSPKPMNEARKWKQLPAYHWVVNLKATSRVSEGTRRRGAKLLRVVRGGCCRSWGGGVEPNLRDVRLRTSARTYPRSVKEEARSARVMLRYLRTCCLGSSSVPLNGGSSCDTIFPNPVTTRLWNTRLVSTDEPSHAQLALGCLTNGASLRYVTTHDGAYLVGVRNSEDPNLGKFNR